MCTQQRDARAGSLSGSRGAVQKVGLDSRETAKAEVPNPAGRMGPLSTRQGQGWEWDKSSANPTFIQGICCYDSDLAEVGHVVDLLVGYMALDRH